MESSKAIIEKLQNEVSLKHILLRNLLSITHAINENKSADELFKMYKTFLHWVMKVKKMALFIIQEDRWSCVTTIDWENIQEEQIKIENFIKEAKIERRYNIKEDDPSFLEGIDVIISVWHKQIPLAYTLVGGIGFDKDTPDKYDFISTITNIIAVAIENKRLFKEQLKRESIRQEMRLAEQVQQMLIPDHLPNNSVFALDSLYIPHDGIGGDYFDYIPFSDTRFSICMADVSGKGISAALLMANFQAIIRSLIRHYRDLGTFIIALNESIRRITKSEKYITFFIADVDLEKKTIKYINAGHYPPKLYHKGNITSLTEGCTIIGFFDDVGEVQEGEVQLEEDMLLLTFTDGLTDILNDNKEMIPESLLDEVLIQNAHLDVIAFNHKLKEVLDQYRGMQSFPDDIAVLSMKYYGKK